MAWTAPKTWSSGETLTAANFNAQIRDNELALGPHLIVRKTSDQSNSTTTLGDDTQLKLASVGVNEIWLVEGMLFMSQATTTDVKLGFTFPSGSVGFMAHSIASSSSGNSGSSPTSQTLTGALLGGANALISLRAIFRCAGTGGTLQLQFAAGSAGTVTMLTDSTLWGVKLA